MQNMEKIYNEYFIQVYKYLFCLTHDRDISEELTQETFCKAIEKINTFRGDCKITVWLCQIAKNLWYNECKKEKYRRKYEEKIEESKTTEEEYIEKEERQELYKRIDKLENPVKEIMYLRITGEMSFKEIGEILNKSENWARVNFYRGKQKLKEGDENEERNGM